MIPTFVLLTAVGGGLRLALNVAVRRKLGPVLGAAPYPGSGCAATCRSA